MSHPLGSGPCNIHPEHPPQKNAELVPCVNEPIKPSKNTDLDSLLAEACNGVPGIDPATFKSLLSPVDVEDIEGGHIPVVTLNAYAQSFAEGIRSGRVVPIRDDTATAASGLP